jgi:hypothetical protein
MIDQKMIPPEVAIAGRNQILVSFWNEIHPDVAEKIARAVLSAGLSAWPNKESLSKPGDWGRYIVLPLNTEARDGPTKTVYEPYPGAFDNILGAENDKRDE